MGSIQTSSSDPREFAPELYPSFPPEILPCIDLESISLYALQNGDFSENARLLSICKEKGFFFLCVTNTAAQYLVHDAEAIGHLSEDLFKLSLEEKMRYPWFRKPNSLLGYKPAGLTKADQHGEKRETAEFMNCGKDDILDIPGRTPTDLPDMLLTSANRSLLARFETIAHQTGLSILSALAVQLGLPCDAFEEMHRIDRPADSHVRLIRGPPRMLDKELEIATPGHTDFGSITLLFNWLGGLQIWSESNHGESFDNALGSDLGPESGRADGQWLWVKPKPGHIIVNLGDLMVQNTGGLLCAGRHRVLPAPGVQGLYPRYSVVYFVRPADDHVTKRLQASGIPSLKEGETEEELTSNQWAHKQFKRLRDGKTARRSSET